MTEKTPKPSGLVGRCFVIWGEDRKWQYQGIVLAKLDFDHYLVQFFEILMGYPSTLAVFDIEQMVAQSAENIRSPGTFEFFENDEHLRDWAEHRKN